MYVKVDGDNTLYINYNDINRNAYISSAGEVLPNPRYYLARTVSHHLFEYVESGRGQVRCDGLEYEVEAGFFNYIRESTQVTYFADRREPYKKVWFGASGELVDKLCEVYFKGRTVFSCRAEVGDLFGKLFERLADGGVGETELLHFLIDMISGAVEAKRSLEPETLASRIRDRLDGGLPKAVPLDELAKQFSVSKRHVIRVFKEEYGVTPAAYSNDRRFETACRLLAETDCSVAFIAFQLGYCDQSYFSSEFRRRAGVYPTVYRAARR